MRVISIITTFDTTKILRSGISHDILNPIKAPQDCLYMVVGEDHLGGCQASGDLIVESYVGDILQWSATSTSGNHSDAVVFSGFEVDEAGVFDQPQPRVRSPLVIDISGDSDDKGFGDNFVAAYWTANIIRAGRSSYKFSFIIRYTDKNDTPALSYYFWESERDDGLERQS